MIIIACLQVALQTPIVVYFSQRLGAAHSNDWSKYIWNIWIVDSVRYADCSQSIYINIPNIMHAIPCNCIIACFRCHPKSLGFSQANNNGTHFLLLSRTYSVLLSAQNLNTTHVQYSDNCFAWKIPNPRFVRKILSGKLRFYWQF